MPFVGQSSLRSDSRSTAKSITTSALSDARIRRHFRGDKQQAHRCSCYGSNEFVAIASSVTWGERGSDFSVGSDCLNAVKAGHCRKQLSKYAENSAVGLPGAGTWTALFCEGVV